MKTKLYQNDVDCCGDHTDENHAHVCKPECKPVIPSTTYKSYCGLPDELHGKHPHFIPMPKPCVEEHCPVIPAQVDPIVPCNPVTRIPPFTQVDMPEGCNWSTERHPSIPPPLPCAPINVGWGQYDGSFNYWSGEPDPSVLKTTSEIPQFMYGHDSFNHVRDLQTSQRHHAYVAVVRDGFVHPISEHEMMALAVHMSRLAHMTASNPEAPHKPKLGLAIAMTGNDSNGLPLYSLTITDNGLPTGNMLPLVTHWDATGEPVELSFPTDGIPNLSAAGG